MFENSGEKVVEHCRFSWSFQEQCLAEHSFIFQCMLYIIPTSESNLGSCPFFFCKYRSTMEHVSFRDVEGSTNQSTKSQVAGSAHLELDTVEGSKEKQGGQRDNPQVSRAENEVGQNIKEDIPTAYTETPGEVNMEASISAEDVMQAGGFGARDDINSFLPVASDFTDFEASILDARIYEEPQKETSRPGLGWTESQK
ncbi:uncharacterized protein LOC113775860 isoform X1 [Coffea eugenioides]|uniref:uncharacterized protein LOC113775860 isoform X1 n=1 Tax=Coffea eugenioides TaxID=49369 RepID=UPI000F613D70|nr:uncharacterized protein LOC113775860 isoform X1 [Coffea eugenioides]